MPSFLPVDEQAAIGDQLYAAGLYPDTCFIQRQSGAVDAAGAEIDEWVTTDIVACRVDAPARQPVEVVSGGSVTPGVDYDVYLYPRSTVVHNTDQILVNGRVLRVVGDQDAISIHVDVKVSTRAAES